MIIGTVPYQNATPLTSALPEDYFVHTFTPTEMVEVLLDGKILAGLIPTHAILKHGLMAYPEAGLIGCDGPVKSVGFFVKDTGPELADISTLYIDHESQTSARLGLIVLNKMFGRNLKSLRIVDIHDSARADAQLLIGDKALFFREPGYRFHDLGTLWKELTGFGFAFAAWASMQKLPKTIVEELTEARLTGSATILNTSHAGIMHGAPITPREEIIRHYLKDNIVYEYTEPLKRGFEQYGQWLTDLNLCPHALWHRAA